MKRITVKCPKCGNDRTIKANSARSETRPCRRCTKELMFRQGTFSRRKGA